MGGNQQSNRKVSGNPDTDKVKKERKRNNVNRRRGMGGQGDRGMGSRGWGGGGVISQPLYPPTLHVCVTSALKSFTQKRNNSYTEARTCTKEMMGAVNDKHNGRYI